MVLARKKASALLADYFKARYEAQIGGKLSGAATLDGDNVLAVSVEENMGGRQRMFFDCGFAVEVEDGK